jgi:hypothetical protein
MPMHLRVWAVSAAHCLEGMGGLAYSLADRADTFWSAAARPGTGRQFPGAVKAVRDPGSMPAASSGDICSSQASVALSFRNASQSSAGPASLEGPQRLGPRSILIWRPRAAMSPRSWSVMVILS